MTKIGVMLNNLERDRIAAWQVVVEEGYPVVHTNALAEDWLTGIRREEYVNAARQAQAQGVTIHTMFIGFDGQDYSDVAGITRTVGLLAVLELRQHRIAVAKQYCDLAALLQIRHVAMHLGFMPKDTEADYQILVEAARDIADYAGNHGQSLHLETGQESGRELVSFLEQVERDNVGVNFDCGNFLLYGSDDPLNALALLGPHVRGVHCKDGFKPNGPGQLGKEVPLGRGAMDFTQFLTELKKLGYTGPLIIERETGPNVRAELRAAREYLGKVLNSHGML